MICNTCGEQKKYAEFYDSNVRDCKECIRKRSAKRRWDNIEEVREYDRTRGRTADRKIKTTETTKRLRMENPLRYKAQTWVSNAIRDRRLIKPVKCCECGKGGQIEGHHQDYNIKEVVDWLCSSCHKILHHSNTALGCELRLKYKIPKG